MNFHQKTAALLSAACLIGPSSRPALAATAEIHLAPDLAPAAPMAGIGAGALANVQLDVGSGLGAFSLAPTAPRL
jgi:hypothetical protein